MPRMQHSTILMLAVGTGLAAFVLSVRLFNAKQQAHVAMVQSQQMIVGAIRDLKVGSMIVKDDVDLLPAPSGVNMNVFFTDFNNVVGKVVRKNVMKGDAIKTVDLLAEGDNLASLIPNGYRAMTIPVILPSDLSSLIQIGNRVDVILTYDQGRGQIESVTLINSAKVIGVSG